MGWRIGSSGLLALLPISSAGGCNGLALRQPGKVASPLQARLTTTAEIYRIVSSKALDQGEGSQNVLGGERKVLEISKSADAETKKGCC